MPHNLMKRGGGGAPTGGCDSSQLPRPKVTLTERNGGEALRGEGGARPHFRRGVMAHLPNDFKATFHRCERIQRGAGAELTPPPSVPVLQSPEAVSSRESES